MTAVEVLVVDDDRAVRESLTRSLTFEGYAVREAADGIQALDTIAATRPAVVVLDLQMPRLDGMEVCRRLRGTGNRVPIVMLTARDATGDRVTGLDAGADDYLPKPFALEELLARLRSVLRRGGSAGSTPDGAGPPEVLRFADVTLDPATREAFRGQRLLSLTRIEHDLLEVFMRHPRQVLSRTQLLREVWGYGVDPSSNTLEVHVGYVRRKLEAGGEPRLLQTVRGVGYTLRAA